MRKGYPANTDKACALIEVAQWETDQLKKLELYQEAVDIINSHISTINRTCRSNEE